MSSSVGCQKPEVSVREGPAHRSLERCCTPPQLTPGSVRYWPMDARVFMPGLLLEIEDAQGNHILREDEVNSADKFCSSGVISQYVVTYHNVEELQQQNQQLLVTVRELTDKQEPLHGFLNFI